MSKNNKGSAVIELCFIMPMLLGIIVLCVFIFIDSINDSSIRSEVYTTLYTYNLDADAEDKKTECIININNQLVGVFSVSDIDICDDEGKICLGIENDYVSGGVVHQYLVGDKNYEVEYDLCTDRLRRWQLYGDIVQ